MTPSASVIVLLLTLTLGLWVCAVQDLVTGWSQRRQLAARSVVDESGGGSRSPLVRVDVWLRRTGLGRRVSQRLTAAGMRLRVSTFLGGLAAVVVAVILLIGRSMAPFFGFVAAIAVTAMCFAYLRRREQRRQEEFIAQLPELARVLSNATSAGLVPRTAIDLAAEEMDEPARSELRRTADAMKVGQSLDEALRDLGQRIPSRELSVLVSTLLVAARSGGSLVTALRNISSTLEDRKEIRREVKTIMGDAVVTNWSVAGLGGFGLIILNRIQPGSLRTMSAEPIGLMILGVSLALFTLSVVIIQRITRIDV